MTNYQPKFLPLLQEDKERYDIEIFDIILVTGDAYVDHPSFGTALLGRLLWEKGFTVGIISQPDWRKNDDFTKLGRPNLFFSVSSGNVDSMVNEFTPALKHREKDLYSPSGNKLRPPRSVSVYTDRLHALFPDTPIIIGGIEASLRRFAHYDYWSDSVRQSVLADAPADLLIFGMGETQICEVAERLSKGRFDLSDIPGTACKISKKIWEPDDSQIIIPSFEEVRLSPKHYISAFNTIHNEMNPFLGKRLAQTHPKCVIVANRPTMPLNPGELDKLYLLPFTRRSHPAYHAVIPALDPIRFSVTSHRGCFGECSFCAISLHQGRIIQSRGEDSIVEEVTRLTHDPLFRGTVTDVGGPTANMYGAYCHKWWKTGPCFEKKCSPECPHLDISQERYLDLLDRLEEIEGVKKVFISSGLRYDLFPGHEKKVLKRLTRHISGHLKVAPEHIVPHVLALMNKPGADEFEKFRKSFEDTRSGKEKRQYLLPYFISGHPGTTMEDMIILAEYMRDKSIYVEQVQDFTPTPMTASTTMYHTGLTLSGDEQIYIPRGHEKILQRAIIHYRDPGKYTLVREALESSKRRDLIGNTRNCLIPDRRKRKK